MLNYITYQQTAFAQNCRVVFDAQTKNCIVCDPGSSGDVPYLYKQIENLGLNPQAIILTHGHHDHCGGAQELARLLKGLNVYVNLIPYNETKNIEFSKSNKDRINKFYDSLMKNGINVTVRREFGGNIKAACGQLRSESD